MTAGLGENTYTAPDYDTLVDSPIVAGSPSVYEFSVAGTPHYLVNFRERAVWNGPQAARDLAKVAETIAQFLGTVPFDRFYCLNIVGSAKNGLEHRNSTVLNIPLDATSTREGYLDWLNLASHEYFHAWNGKRLRPVELGPFDYENEVYTRALWFVEGITEYYADLFLVRAGVTTRAEYLDALSNQIQSLQTTPGRLEQSVEAASYDASIKYYRTDENSPNTSISYYVKGAVIGFLLDANVRRLTAGWNRSMTSCRRCLRSFRVSADFQRRLPRVGGGRRWCRKGPRDTCVAGARSRNDGRAGLYGCLGWSVSVDISDWNAAIVSRRGGDAAPRRARLSSPAFAAGRRPRMPACHCWMKFGRSTASRCRKGASPSGLRNLHPERNWRSR